MKYLSIIILVLLAGCSIKHSDNGTQLRVGTDNLVYGSGTCIGISVSMSEASAPVKAVVGFDRYEFLSKPAKDKSPIDIGTEGAIGLTGTIIEGKQHLKVGARNGK